MDDGFKVTCLCIIKEEMGNGPSNHFTCVPLKWLPFLHVSLHLAKPKSSAKR